MTKKIKKILIITISVVASFVLACFLCVYFLFLHHYAGKGVVYNWSASDQFEIENVATVTKQKNKDFVILNLADVQMADLEDIFHYGTMKKEIAYLIETAKPDLITLTGDQTWSNENLISLTSLVRWLDGFKIPYAPVFGNHDSGNQKDSAVLSQNACCDIYEQGKYCLFKRGPTNLGALGNYVVNIVEDNKIVKTLYMMDYGREEQLTNSQIDWFCWNAEGIKQANGGEYSEGMCFMHKPIKEFKQAYLNNPVDPNRQVIGSCYAYWYLGSSDSTDFFDQAKMRGVTDIVCGHEHGNNFTIKYNDIRLTFALKTGELVGYYEDEEIYLNGATKFTISGEQTMVESVFVPRNQFSMK